MNRQIVARNVESHVGVSGLLSGSILRVATVASQGQNGSSTLS
jgi:hypothetical protein